MTAAQHDFILCLRDVDAAGDLTNRPGPAKYLISPQDRLPRPGDMIAKDDWLTELIGEISVGPGGEVRAGSGDVLVFIHGYNNDMDVAIRRHRLLRRDLMVQGFRGVVVSFDWPSVGKRLGYWNDRRHAKATAANLVSDFIQLFCFYMSPECGVKIHLLGHSTGAYVIREAFAVAEGTLETEYEDWMVGQVMFAAADVASHKLSPSDEKGAALYRRCHRLTNYHNRHDRMLKLSRFTGFGVKDRAGIVGLPDDAPEDKAVDVDCSRHFKEKEEKNSVFYGNFSHSWHIGDALFARDVLYTIEEDITADRITTRRPDPVTGKLSLR